MTLDHLLLLLQHEAEHFKAHGIDLRTVQVNVLPEDEDGTWRDVREIQSVLQPDDSDAASTLTIVVSE